jgi:hypothetical protein
MKKTALTERVYVYCPKGVKGALIELVGEDGGSVSGYILSLIRDAIREQKKFSTRPHTR